MGLLPILGQLLIVAVIVAIFWFGLNAIPGLPQPAKVIITLVALLLGLLWLFGGLTGASGGRGFGLHSAIEVTTASLVRIHGLL